MWSGYNMCGSSGTSTCWFSQLLALVGMTLKNKLFACRRSNTPPPHHVVATIMFSCWMEEAALRRNVSATTRKLIIFKAQDVTDVFVHSCYVYSKRILSEEKFPCLYFHPTTNQLIQLIIYTIYLYLLYILKNLKPPLWVILRSFYSS